ncbi:hypothetical protein ASG67_16200 [Sphingomonas sp. Leaf339]|uniref:flagellar filament capping protein FliD n=1 Tax=Sphingomonas sp. Leaf339 TaxID=1736343 RepID=UPI0006FC93FF|nr:flagellar filament capping protein FliD [Sphingomonas sp. Leaf339]KQU61545.1 hypothetical protein ASG67_16200 [Sphingomonas sp. Leaf339]
MATTTAVSSTTSITTALGAGSGVDTKALVASLVEAQYAAKNSQFTAKSDTLTAQISGIAKLKSGISGFDAALKSLVKGGTLATQPTSSNAGVVAVSSLAGGKVAGLSAQLTVQQLAGAQAATTKVPVSATAGFRAGTLSVNIGSYTTDAGGTTTLSPNKSVAIDVADGATLAQIAAQITAQTGLKTALVKDGDGQRLTIKGATGATQAFEIAGSDTGGSGLSLSSLSVDANATGTTVGTAAQDAVMLLDGARFTRSSNTVSDLVSGVKLDLMAASTTPVTLGTSAPSASLSQAASDFVATFNELLGVINEETNITSGVLKSDSAASGMARTMGRLTTTVLATSTTGGPQTLADIGVSTNRDGTLSLNTARLTAAIAKDPASVEALFADGAGASNGGISAALSAVATTLTSKTSGLDALTTRYTKQQTDLSTAKSKISDAATAMSTRLTQQYATMDARVAAYKSTQTFLTQQIAAWNKSDS